MSQLNEFDNFNFSGFTGVTNQIEGNENAEGGSSDKKHNSCENINEDLSNSSNFEDNFEIKKFDKFPNKYKSPSHENKMNETLSNLYGDSYIISREGSAENVLIEDYNKDSIDTINHLKEDSFNKNEVNPGMESKMSFENSCEQFFDKDSDILESDEANVWEIERLKRIEERKEYEIRMRKEIKEKAAEDLKKWYEEMAVKIEEKKNIFNQQKLEEEKKRQENLQDKTWVKVSQYLEFEKGDYFKEDSRIKQILLKLIKQENA